MNISLEEVKTLINVDLVPKLESAFIEYAKIVGIEESDEYSLVPTCIQNDKDEFTFEWEETWRYGGYEYHKKYMPVRFVTDYDNWMKEQTEKERKLLEQKDKEKEQERLSIEEKEKKLLLELQKKYSR